MRYPKNAIIPRALIMELKNPKMRGRCLSRRGMPISNNVTPAHTKHRAVLEAITMGQGASMLISGFIRSQLILTCTLKVC
jgi:hypothetical protein